jgi:glucan 1,3-beta-glucosidase
MHVTSSASGLYMENVWLWVADHEIDDNPNLIQITVYAGRGLLIESTGPLWLYGTAVEHHVLYQYQLNNAQSIILGQIQTETAYYQPNPIVPAPFTVNSTWSDPTTYANGLQSGWGLRILNSNNVAVYGAGLYSFFSNNDVTCSNQGNGEACQSRIFSSEESSAMTVYNLNTIGTVNMWTNNGNDVAVFSDNLNGFSDGVALVRI